jgi:multiple antibiotic resistance protein
MDPLIQSTLQLVVLFLVIFEPFVSMAVFVAATQNLGRAQRNRAATMAVVVAGAVSLAVLLFGQGLFAVLDTDLDDFRVAGGIILVLLGLKMVWGQNVVEENPLTSNSARAVAAIIGSPLLTGPAAITSIMIAVNDYGRLVTGLAVAIVLGITALMLFLADFINKFLGYTSLQVISTILGLITISWGVKFIRIGLGF